MQGHPSICGTVVKTSLFEFRGVVEFCCVSYENLVECEVCVNFVF